MSVLKTYGEGFSGFAPSDTYRLENGRIHGRCGGKTALSQAIELLLSTERWSCRIFSGDYGAELLGLCTRSVRPNAADIRRRIEEALFEDDRISAIEDFAVRIEGDTAHISFCAVTDFGDIAVERGVSLG